MKVGQYEAEACGAIYQHYRDKLNSDEAAILSQVDGAYACNDSLPYEVIERAMAIVTRVRS